MTLWFSSDPHFGHWNIVHKFKQSSGLPTRSFESTEAMDEIIVKNHNELVKPEDHWYCLGDIAMREDAMHRVMPRLNGHKRLVRGNHDIFKTKHYLKYFDEIHGVRVFDNMIFSHIPIAPWSIGKMSANVHGHTHLSTPLVYRAADPLGPGGFTKSKLYINISMERTAYKPLSLEQIKKLVDRAQTH